MDNYTKRKAIDLLEKYLVNENYNGNNDFIISQLEELTLNGKEFIEILKETLPKNYVKKRDYEKLEYKLDDIFEIKVMQSLK